MKFKINLVPSVHEDLNFYKARGHRIIIDAIEKFLGFDADVESKRRKKLRSNPLAPWELRIGEYRIFYDVETKDNVNVLAIGHKVHNELFIRGKRVEL